jgi:hypothetical protein
MDTLIENTTNIVKKSDAIVERLAYKELITRLLNERK